MIYAAKYDKFITGALAGVFLPFFTGLLIYLFSTKGLSVTGYLERISETNILTHSISLCVFPNVVIFLLFNRFDMLRACRGILSVTIIWAVIVFLVKFLG
jgi:hypothetical protein